MIVDNASMGDWTSTLVDLKVIANICSAVQRKRKVLLIHLMLHIEMLFIQVNEVFTLPWFISRNE